MAKISVQYTKSVKKYKGYHYYDEYAKIGLMPV